MTTLTVTATNSGGGSLNGMALTVKVLTGTFGPGATASSGSVTSPQLAITPAGTGSKVYGAVFMAGTSTAITANGSTTFNENQSDTTATTVYGTFETAGTTTSGTPVTVGGSAPAGQTYGIVLLEMLSAGALAEDSSAPASLGTTTAKTLTTASFTPPPGSYLVATVAADGSGTATSGNDSVVSVTDSSGLTWTKQVEQTLSPAGGVLHLASVWTAQVPGVFLDASTPAVATLGNGTHTAITSPSFSPPANSLIVAVYNQEYSGSGNTQPTLTPSSTGTSLSWTAGPEQWQASLNGNSAQFAAWNASAQTGITVSVTPSASYSGGAQLQVFVLTDTDANSVNGGGTASWSGSSSTVENASITTTAAGSMVLAAALGINAGTYTPTGGISTYGTQFNDSTAGNSAVIGTSSPVVTPGTSTMGWTISPACLTNGVLWEILPAGAGTAPGYTGTDGKLASPAQPGLAQPGAFIPGQTEPSIATRTASVTFAGVTAHASFGGVKTALAHLASNATAHATFAGTRTQFAHLTANATAHMAPAGVRTTAGHLTANATAHAVFAGTKTGLAHLSPAATAHAVFAGTKTGLGHLASNVTAHAAFAGSNTVLSHLAANVTAHSVFAGVKTALGHLTSNATAHAAFAGTKAGFTWKDGAAVQATTGVNTISATLTAAVAAGDLLVAVVGGPDVVTSSMISDTAGNSWQVAEGPDGFTCLIYCLASVAAPSGLTLTVASGNFGTRFLAVDRFDTSGYPAVLVSKSGLAAPFGTSGNADTFFGLPSGNLVYGGTHTDAASVTFTAGSSGGVSAVSHTSASNGSGSGFTEYVLSSASGAQSLSWTSSAGCGPGAVQAGFALLTGSPAVTGFTPTDGAGGTNVVITGKGFTGATAVTFGGVAAASYTVNSDTQITAVTASATVNGAVAVTAGGVTGTSIQEFWADNQVLTGSNVVQLDGDVYHLQGNEFSSVATFDIATDNSPDFRIITSAISNSLGGSPGAYPSLYAGNHFGFATSPNPFPVPVSMITSGGAVTTTMTGDVSLAVPGSAWDFAYDIWFTANATDTQTSAGALEMMIWLDYSGPTPAGTKTVSGATVNGYACDIWWTGGGPGGTVSYVLNDTSGVTGLDVGLFAADAVTRGFMTSGYFLIDVEGGFEVWQGGAGLSVTGFSVTSTAHPGSLAANAAAHASFGGTRTQFAHLSSAVTAHAVVAGTKTGLAHLTAGITAHGAFTGTKTGLAHLAPSATAHMAAAGTKTVHGLLATTATAHAAFAGVKTAKGASVFSATAEFLVNGFNSTIRQPQNLGGSVTSTVFSGMDSEVANQYGGTLSAPVFGGGLVSANTGGTADLVANVLGGTISAPDLGGTLGMVNYGGGAVGWTMQKVDQNFPEFNDITLNVSLTSNGSALNLTGYTVKMLLKPQAGVVDGDARNIVLSSGGVSPAISIVSAPAGTCNIAIANADVQDQVHTFYRIDAVDPSGNINTCIYGTVTYTAL